MGLEKRQRLFCKLIFTFREKLSIHCHNESTAVGSMNLLHFFLLDPFAKDGMVAQPCEQIEYTKHKEQGAYYDAHC